MNVYLFVDALGYELIDKYHFCEQILPYRYRVRTQLGYSAGALPTIMSGQPPEKHLHFSFFRYTQNSPFKWMRHLPNCLFSNRIFENHRVRNRLSRYLKKTLGYTGYFQLYAMPFKKLGFMTYTEQRDIFTENGLDNVKNLSDFFKDDPRRFFISDWRLNPRENIRLAAADIREKKHDVYFVYTADFDGYMHAHAKASDHAIRAGMAQVARDIRALLSALRSTGEPFTFTLFSDHGMTPLEETLDLRAKLDALPLRLFRDYICVLDSTMARFWFFNARAKNTITELLLGLHQGSILSEMDLKRYEINFPDHAYGELIFLLNPGVQCVPSDMGAHGLPGMHGYTPDHPDSDAACLSTAEPPFIPHKIKDFYRLMTHLHKEHKNG